MENNNIVLIAAISENNVIGKNNTLPWKLKDDLRLFSNLTKTHTVIMGRKNYESIGKPLPDRLNIVLSRDNDYEAPGCIVTNSLASAIDISAGCAFIIGGADIYREGLKVATHFFRTSVQAVVDGDVFFPEYNKSEWESCYSVEYLQDINSGNEYSFTFEILKSVYCA